MGKLSSIFLGTVSGVAAALFLTSDKGKQVRSQAQEFFNKRPLKSHNNNKSVCKTEYAHRLMSVSSA